MHLSDVKYGLFGKRRFMPIFMAQFLGAFNDNMLRSGLVVLIAYAGRKGIPLPIDNAEVLVTICSALLVMPFIFFSFLAGQLADKCEKARLVTYTKIAEIGIMAVAFYGFSTNNVHLLMIMLFISGTHSTFFGPIKYSILPEHLRPGELLAGNGFISGGTYIGILFGLIAGGLLIEVEGNIIGYMLVAVAVAGYFISLLIPRENPAHPDLQVDFHIFRGTRDMIRMAQRSNSAFFAIMGLSWFLLVGSVFMAQFANYAEEVIGGNNEVYTLFLAIFSIGIAIGSVLSDTLLKGEVCARFAPVALVCVSVFTVLMVAMTPLSDHEHLLTFGEFLFDITHLPLLASMMLVAVSGGIYMVPLYAMLQTECDSGARSRVIAASNLFDSLFMTAAAIVCAILLAWGMSIPQLFLLLAVCNLSMCLYVRKGATRYADRAA